jgi:hypothetical protein
VSGTIRSIAGFLLAWAWLGLTLDLPNWTGNLLGPDHLRPSAEVAILFGLLALATATGWKTGRHLPALLAALVMVVVALRFADFASNMLIGRPVNLSLDLMLLPAILEVLTGSASRIELAVACLLVPLALAVLFALNRAAIGTAALFLERPLNRRLFAGTLAAMVVLSLTGAKAFAPLDQGAAALLAGQVADAIHSSSLRAEYLTQFRQDGFAALPDDAVLAHLGRRDVYVMFFESYGETVLTNPQYRSIIEPTLVGFEAALAKRGFGMRSGLMESPIRGGQSWLAHGTFMSGARLGDQGLYNLMLTSGRQSLARYFGRAGYRTLAVMPALSRPWPEGEFWGFEKIWRTKDMGYAGPHFGWAAIPDQYTLDFIDRQVKRQRDKPLFIEYALISSHGPWEPLPPLLDDWDSLGDGSVFAGVLKATAPAGQPSTYQPLTYQPLTYQPMWSDITRKYVDSVDYTLKVLRDYISRYVTDDSLIIILGDHQPAPLITGEGASRSVPIHIISRDPELLAPFGEWGFIPGMVPRTGKATLPMEQFRDHFLAAFSARQTG